MSTNISKQKREDLIHKINAIRTFIANSPQDKNTGNLLNYLSDLEKDINGKKYGLIFEEHRENIDNLLDTHTPVLTEDKSLFIDNGGDMNFLIEGDNLAALQLLEKTHKGKIDVIYIDPPYNRGKNDFIYDDNYVDSKDLYKHSKWLSFMSKRLEVAKHLLSNEGVIFIQIDDNEQAGLKILCDSILGSDNFMGTFIQNKLNAKNDTINIQKNHEYIIAYRKKTIFVSKTRIKPTLIQKKIKLRPVFEEDNKYFYIGDSITTRGEGGILNARPNLGYTVYYNPKTNDKIAVNDYDIEMAKTSNSTKKVYSHDLDLIDKGYIPIIPPKVRGKLGCWTWSLEKFNKEKNNIIISKTKSRYNVKKRTFVSHENIIQKDNKFFFQSIEYSNSKSILEYSTNDGTKTLTEIMNEKGLFNNPKNLELVQYLISLKPGKHNIVLDFFAGSGTTGHAVMQLNKDYNESHKYILCTNNQNNICRDITYKRLANVIKGYGDNAPIKSSLKYYKVDYIPINKKMYYEYADELLKHVRELVELENGINFTHNEKIAIILTDDELSEFISNIDTFKNCETIYLGHDVLPSEEQEEAIKSHNINLNIIPDYYYRNLQEM